MTTKYKFTDKSLKLGKRLILGLSKFIDARNLECKHKHDNEHIMHLLISLEAAFSEIFEYSGNDLNQTLDSLLNRDYLTFTEALFILHGFYPSSCIDLKKNQESDDMDTYDHTFLLNYFKDESETYTDLLSAIAAGKESDKHGIQSDSKDGVYTEQFILWAIDKGFVYQEPDTNNQRHTNKNNEETGIPMLRYVIYTETLPKYLKKLKQSLEPITTNGLSTTDAGKLGEYFEVNKNRLGCAAGTVRKDLTKLYKSTWWTSQPEEIRSKWQIKHK